MKRFTTKCILFLFNFAVLAGYAQAAEVALKVLDGVELHAFASSSYTFNFNQPTQRPPNSATNVNRIFDADHNSFKFDVGELVILKDTPKPGDVGLTFAAPVFTSLASQLNKIRFILFFQDEYGGRQGIVEGNSTFVKGVRPVPAAVIPPTKTWHPGSFCILLSASRFSS